MTNINKLVLAGRLTRDPESKVVGDMTIVRVGMAVNERKKVDGTWVDEPVYVDVRLFGKRAEAFLKYHSKGSQCCFPDARLAFDQWDDKETGKRRSHLYVIANSWEFIGAKQDTPTPF